MIYIIKTNFSNGTIVNLAKECIDKNNLIKNDNRLHLKNRASLRNSTVDNTEDLQKKEIVRRIARARELNGPRVSVFDQLKLPDAVEQKILEQLPEQLLRLNPTIAVQIIQGGTSCTPHRDHSRTTSLFYLYTEPNVLTIWWEKIEDFEEYHDLRYADIDKIKEVKREVIDQNSWYIFNNHEYHSIHAINGAKIDRKTLVIEFNDLSADQLNEILNEY